MADGILVNADAVRDWLVEEGYPPEKISVIKNGTTLVQDAEYHNLLHHLAEDLGLGDRLLFAGHRSDVPGLLSQATISVLPSHSEGLSNTLLESMAAGLPIVATRVGGNPELVRDGENGFLIPPHDPMALAAAISRILNDPALAARFGRRSIQMSKDDFGMQRMVEKTEAFYVSRLERKLRPIKRDGKEGA